MKALEYIKKTREYLDYLEEHINNVDKAGKLLQNTCFDMRFIYDDYVFFTIDGEIKYHDISKFSIDEFVPYRKRFYPVEQEDYNMDLNAAGYNHLKINDHHGQNGSYKNSYNPYKEEISCVHMLVDGIAMGYKFNNTAQSYYEENKHIIKLPDWSIDFIYQIFNRINKRGYKGKNLL